MNRVAQVSRVELVVNHVWHVLVRLFVESVVDLHLAGFLAHEHLRKLCDGHWIVDSLPQAPLSHFRILFLFLQRGASLVSLHGVVVVAKAELALRVLTPYIRHSPLVLGRHAVIGTDADVGGLEVAAVTSDLPEAREVDLAIELDAS